MDLGVAAPFVGMKGVAVAEPSIDKMQIDDATFIFNYSTYYVDTIVIRARTFIFFFVILCSLLLLLLLLFISRCS